MRVVIFAGRSLEDLGYFIEHDRKLAVRILRLIQETRRDPFGGIGKPEPLKGGGAGKWSRRVNDEHRIVYEVSADSIRVVACRFHYDD